MFNFKHKNVEFFDLFVQSAEYFHKAAVIMNDVMHDCSTAEARMHDMIDLEHEADAANDRIIDRLNQTFITPIDREDIFALVNGLDDGVDLMQGALQRVVIYRTAAIREGAIAFVQLLLDATAENIRAFSLLKDIKKNRLKILECTHKINKLESQGDAVYRMEVGALFDNLKDPVELIKWKDILEQLENTLDHCEKVADLLRGVVMKYA